MTQPTTEAGALKRPFRRSTAGSNTKDAVGRVRVQVTLLSAGGGHHARGNIVRSFTVKSSTVSSVANRVEQALFEVDE